MNEQHTMIEDEARALVSDRLAEGPRPGPLLVEEISTCAAEERAKQAAPTSCGAVAVPGHHRPKGLSAKPAQRRRQARGTELASCEAGEPYDRYSTRAATATTQGQVIAMNRDDMREMVSQLEALEALATLFNNLWFDHIKRDIRNQKV